jgi:protein TonB
LASIAAHALILVLLPEWARQVDQPAPVLEVVMVAAEALPAVSDTPPALPSVPPSRAKPRQSVRAAPPVAAPAPVAMPQPVAEFAPAVAAASYRADPQPGAESPPVLASRAPAVAVAQPATPPVFKATYLHNPPPHYPAVARRNGDQGTVMLKVLLNMEGAPVHVEVDKSSGSPPLDSAALDAVKTWRFAPARRGAQNIESWVRVPVVFRLES